MVKVIGKKNLQASCENCLSVLSYEKKDIVEGTKMSNKLDYSSLQVAVKSVLESQNFITCPTCNNRVMV